MSLKPLLDAFERTPAVQDLSERLPSRATALRLGGLPGSSAAVLVAWLVRSFPQRLLTIVAPTPADAERWLSDLGHLTDAPTVLYPQREALGEEEPHYEIAGERAETLEALLSGQAQDPGDDRPRNRRAHAGAGRAGAAAPAALGSATAAAGRRRRRTSSRWDIAGSARSPRSRSSACAEASWMSTASAWPLRRGWMVGRRHHLLRGSTSPPSAPSRSCRRSPSFPSIPALKRRSRGAEVGGRHA